MRRLNRYRLPRALLGILGAVMASAPSAHADGGIEVGRRLSPQIEQELRYASFLYDHRLPDFMTVIIERLEQANPHEVGLRARIKRLRLQGVIAKGDFAAAERLIAEDKAAGATQSDVWAMRLAVADGYFGWGRYPEARMVYEEFFSAFADSVPADLRDFFIESSYRFARMLLILGEDMKAVEQYERTLKVDMERHIRRQLLGEQAEIYLRLAEKHPEMRNDLFAKIEKINDEILWVQDLWFGKAIVNMAFMRMMQDDVAGAQKLVDDYRSQLENIDRQLQEDFAATGVDLTHLSPMAQCRYLLGDMLLRRAEKLIETEPFDKAAVIDLLAGERNRQGTRVNGAYHHFLNVFVRYPNTPWAPDAGAKAQRVEEILRQCGIQVRSQITPEQIAEVERLQFQTARVLYMSARYAEAVEAYKKVLALFPNSREAPAAIGNLARSYLYIEEDDPDKFYFLTTALFLAERFGRNPETMLAAGDQILNIAAMLTEAGAPDLAERLYQYYLYHVPDHPQMAAMRFRFAEEAFQAKNFQMALSYFEVIATNFPASPVGVPAKRRIAESHAALGNIDRQIEALDTLIARLGAERRPGHAFVASKFQRAQALKALADAETRALREAAAEPKTAESDGAVEPTGAAETAGSAAAVSDEERKALDELDRQIAEQAEEVEKFAKFVETYETFDAAAKRVEPHKDTDADMGKRFAEFRATADRFKPFAERYPAMVEELEALKQRRSAAQPGAGPATGDEQASKTPLIIQAHDAFAEVVTLLDSADAVTRYGGDERENEANKQIYQAALFLKGVCSSMRPGTEEERRKYMSEAADVLMAFAARYPESTVYASKALSQVGTLATLLGDAQKAERALSELQRRYPDTPEAQNADFMLAMSLLSMGYRHEATVKFKQMFAGDARYAASQVLMAGIELERSQEFAIAAEAFERVLQMEGEESTSENVRRSLLQLGATYMAHFREIEKRDRIGAIEAAAKAAKALQAYKRRFPNTAGIVDAALNLSQAYAALAEQEQDATKRFGLFNEALKEIGFARNHIRQAQNIVGLVRSDLEVGRIHRRQMLAEIEAGNAEGAEAAQRRATATYQSIVLLADRSRPENLPYIEEAFHESAPLLIDLADKTLEKVQGTADPARQKELRETARQFLLDVVSDGAEYLALFPRGRFKLAIMRAQSDARIRLTGLGVATTPGSAPPAAAPSAPPTVAVATTVVAESAAASEADAPTQ